MLNAPLTHQLCAHILASEVMKSASKTGTWSRYGKRGMSTQIHSAVDRKAYKTNDRIFQTHFFTWCAQIG